MPQTDEQQIRQLVSTWIDATKRGDTATILSLMTDDVIFLIPGHSPMIGKSAFAAASQAQSQNGPPKFEGNSEIQEIQILGDWAYIWTKLSVSITPPGVPAPIHRAGHTLSILKKQNGHWLLHRDANLLAPVASKG
jgi:uncharacterized protein (TIGR02246 family)